jgi:hypothetical protein
LSRIRINPDDASALAILAQEVRPGNKLSNYPDLTEKLTGKSLLIAKVLFGSKETVGPEIHKAVADLSKWVAHLRSGTKHA